ncbi:hypothetical protein SacmaDRAFT_1040 [Saccharomonospora marina XMU15]|uniref:DUF998 domain-containing protein n=1 Tax=Saccharomonospora marina XMU15 TaxID=882083 RepID=H5XB97_9PSEU|nr:DUF998 domain-containing protein [Saccharomonospora marina]EHR49332.1 hypothetical protein SacmaDRAFT_1040 [Saccharomonospora marina XMU15]
MLPVLRRSATLAAVRGLTVALLSVGTAAHLGWVLEYFLDTGLSPLHSFPGELSADGQPHREVFRMAEWVAGAAFLLAVPPLLRVAPVHWQGRLTVAVVCVFGLLLLLHATFPPDCAPSVSQLCRDRDDVSASHRIHHATSVLLTMQYVVGPATLVLWWRGGWQAIPVLVLAVELLAWAAMVALGLLGSWRFVGLAARAQLAALTVLLCAGMAYLLTIGRDVRDRWEDVPR